MAVDDATHGRFAFWFYLLPGEEPEKIKRQVETAFRKIKGPGAFRLEWPPRILPAGKVAPDHPFVQCAVHSYRKATGRTPVLTGAFMSDMGMLLKYGGFPCINFGPSCWGRPGAVHQPDEFVEVEAVMKCLKTVVICALEWCR